MQRRIDPTDDVTPSADVGTPPSVEWVDPSELLIDEAYQRELSRNSRRLIRRIVAEFSWRKFKPPIVSRTARGLEVIDGQHTAVAAASHPLIPKIPVLVVEALAQTDRADSFRSHNLDRVAITQMQLFFSSVVAQDPTALAVSRACEAAGVTVLRAPPSKGYPAGSTVAIKSISMLIKRRGEEAATLTLRCLRDAGCAPISSPLIKAAEALIYDSEFAITPQRLTQLVRDCKGVESEAAIFTEAHNVPTWRALVIVYFRRSKRYKT